MEIIKNYLENMFMNLPDTPEVRKAKDELWQMMEDKYTMLLEEGRTENEAVGTVISEFGNLSELAEALGIEGVMKPAAESEPEPVRRMVTMDQAAKFLRDRSMSALLVGIGVFLCITCVMGPIVVDSFKGRVPESLGILYMFLSIAVGVALFIYSGKISEEWSYLHHEQCSIDFATSKFIQNDKNSNKDTLALLQIIGIVFCIISVVPAAVIDDINPKIPYVLDIGDIGGALLFLFVGIGVLLTVYATKRMNSYRYLLGINDSSVISGGYTREMVEEDKRSKSFLKSVYWPTITCIYLSWSFLTFDWHITWIIWPIAAIISSLISVLSKNDN